MSQQIINIPIPINWDDDAINICIEKGIVEVAKDKLKEK